MHLPFDDVKYSPMLALTLIASFFVADVKCGLYEKQRSKCYMRTESDPKSVRRPDRTEVMLDRTESKPKSVETRPNEVMLDRRGPGPVPVLTLVCVCVVCVCIVW